MAQTCLKHRGTTFGPNRTAFSKNMQQGRKQSFQQLRGTLTLEKGIDQSHLCEIPLAVALTHAKKLAASENRHHTSQHQRHPDTLLEPQFRKRERSRQLVAVQKAIPGLFAGISQATPVLASLGACVSLAHGDRRSGLGLPQLEEDDPGG